MTSAKVLFLPKWYPNQDDPQLGIFIRKHARAVAQSHQVAILYLQPDSTIARYQLIHQSKDGLEEFVLYYPSSRVGVQTMKKVLNFWQYVRYTYIGWKKVLDVFGKPAITHIHVMNRPSLLAIYLQIRHQIPFYISEHWSGYITQQYAQQSWLKRQYTQWVFKKAVSTSVVSEQLKVAMTQQHLANVKYVIPNVVEAIPESVKCEELPVIIPASSFIIIGMVADLRDEIKNISGVLIAVKKVLKTRQDFQLHIVGGGPDEAILRQKAIDMELQDHVFFHGRQDNQVVLPFLQKIHFLILNSYYETFSVVAAEALAAGKPVISTKCGGPEVFLDEQAGRLIPVGEEEALVEAIQDMLDKYQDFLPSTLKWKVNRFYGLKQIGQKFEQMYVEGLGFGKEIE